MGGIWQHAASADALGVDQRGEFSGSQVEWGKE
jgi:hypothetical protein